MVLMGIDLPLPAIQRQIASGLDIIVHLGRLRDKSRKVLEVTEVLDYQDGEIKLQTLYRYEEVADAGRENHREEGRSVQGYWKKVCKLTNCEKLVAAGYYRKGTVESRCEGNDDPDGDGVALLPECLGNDLFATGGNLDVPGVPDGRM